MKFQTSRNNIGPNSDKFLFFSFSKVYKALQQQLGNSFIRDKTLIRAAARVHKGQRGSVNQTSISDHQMCTAAEFGCYHSRKTIRSKEGLWKVLNKVSLPCLSLA